MKYAKEIPDETSFGDLSWKERSILWSILLFDLFCLYGIYLLIDKVYRILTTV